MTDSRFSLQGRVLRMARTGTLVTVGAAVTSHHLRRDRDHETVIGAVEAHPADPARVVLRNVGAQPWTMKPDGEPAKTVQPARRLAVRTMTIDFGSVRGRILGS